MVETLQTAHCTMRLSEPAPGVVLLVIEGSDVGELGEAPFRALDARVAPGDVSLFIDARASRGATVDVSDQWARWLKRRRPRLRRTTMLTGTRYVAITASFVARFAELGDAMVVLTDPERSSRPWPLRSADPRPGRRPARGPVKLRRPPGLAIRAVRAGDRR